MSYWRAAIEGDLNEVAENEKAIAARAITSGVRLAATYTKNSMERQMQQSMFGTGRLRGTWRTDSAPRGAKVSLKAAAWTFTKARRIVAAFSEDRVIRGQGFLLVPTQDAIRLGLDKSFARSKGPNARRYLASNEIAARFKRVWTEKTKDGTVLLMVLYQGRPLALAYVVPQVRLRKVFDLDATAAVYSENLGAYISAAWNRAERPKSTKVTVGIEG